MTIEKNQNESELNVALSGRLDTTPLLSLKQSLWARF